MGVRRRLSENEPASAGIRTTIQGAIVVGAIRLVEVVPDPDLSIDDADKAIITVIGLGVVAYLQNLIENRQGLAFLKPDYRGREE